MEDGASALSVLGVTDLNELLAHNSIVPDESDKEKARFHLQSIEDNEMSGANIRGVRSSDAAGTLEGRKRYSL